MCHQRERLIGYVYEESDAADRDEVRRHLETCAECRDEIAAFRAVREDLQAWEVPPHESVWRPFAPAPVASWWRQVPVWARAAAAGLVLSAGAAGGAAVQAIAPPAGATAVSADELSAAEQRVLDQVRAEFGGVRPAGADDPAAVEARILASLRTEMARLSGRVQPASFTASAGDANHAALVAEVERLQAQNRDYLEVIARIYANLDSTQRASELKHASLETKIANLHATVLGLAQPR